MKNLTWIFFVIFNLMIVNSQQVNGDNNGYVQIVNSKLKQKEIYIKLKEWIALSYNKPEEVINLDSDSKIILKGLLPLEYKVYERTLDRNSMVQCNLSSTLMFSIKDYRFKVDLVITDIETKDPYLVAETWFYEELISPNTKTKEQYRLNKKGAKTDESTMNQYYLNYITNKNYLDNFVNNMYSSIKEVVDSKEDW